MDIKILKKYASNVKDIDSPDRWEYMCSLVEFFLEHKDITKTKYMKDWLEKMGYYRAAYWVEKFGISRQYFHLRVKKDAHIVRISIHPFYSFPEGYEFKRKRDCRTA